VTGDDARHRFLTSRVARLATVDVNGQPHIVPVVFAASDDTIYSAVDAKPKRSTALRRLANVRANPKVALLADYYDEDWTQLWWARADGTGRVLDKADAETQAEAERAIALLCARYPQHERARPTGPVLAVDVERWSGWSAS
jgi:PPOX class probable F420-dependent enzyme